jgi:hypothetical protein
VPRGTRAVQHTRETGKKNVRGDGSWEHEIRPLFARSCTPCHFRDGEAGLDLTTVSAWKSRRADLRRCVVDDKIMPPSGHPFSEADREIVRTWIDGNE